MAPFILFASFIGLFIGIFILIFRLAIKQLLKIFEQFDTLAHHFNGTVERPEKTWYGYNGYPRLVAEVNGEPLECYMFTRGSGKNKTTYTAFTLGCTNRYNYSLRIAKEGLFSKIGKALGMQDIEVNDPVFDRSFVIKSNDDFFAKTVLMDIKEYFSQTKKLFHGSLELRDGEFKYQMANSLLNDKSRSDFEQIIHLATALSEEVKKFSNAQNPIKD